MTEGIKWERSGVRKMRLRARVDGKKLVDIEGVVHSESADGTDFTLCGLAPEGGDGRGPVIMPGTRKRIDCVSCLGIIRFCKRIRLPREEPR